MGIKNDLWDECYADWWNTANCKQCRGYGYCQAKPRALPFCKKNGTEACKDPEHNRPNGVCVMQGCPQAGRRDPK
jgi:hypothetical protein